MESPVLEYEPLHGSTTIRLLRIQADPMKSDLRCSLYDYDLDDNPRYTALSYEWSGPKCWIEVNDSRCQIQQNLQAFLEVLRSRSFLAVTVWVDAICINQTDMRERERQIQLMRKIFMRAETVISWLGPSDFGTATALAFANSSIWRSDGGRLELDTDDVDVRKYLEGWNAEFLASRGDDEQAHIIFKMFEHFRILSKRRYWTRAWIVPEVLLARKVLLLSGSSATDWACLESAIEFLLSRSDADADELGLWPVMRLRKQSKANPVYSMPMLIQRFGLKQCVLIVDRIYALMGIHAAREDNLPITVNYQASRERLSIDTLHYGLKQKQDVDYNAIAYCQRLQHTLSLAPQGCLVNVLPLRADLTKAPCSWMTEFHIPICKESLILVGSVDRRHHTPSLNPDVAEFRLDGSEHFLLTSASAQEGHFVYRVAKSRAAIICQEKEQRSGLQRASNMHVVGIGAIVTHSIRTEGVPDEYFHHRLDGAIDLRDHPTIRLSLLDVIVFASLPWDL